jgi:Tfp pilus assembly protein FimV
MPRRRSRDHKARVVALRQPQPDILSPLSDLTGRQMTVIGVAILVIGLASLLLVG